METRTFFLLLGSNLGDREKMLRSAVEAIEQQIGEIAMKSALYETAAFDMEDSPDFLNQAIKLNTSLPPKNVLKKIHQIEQEFGRIRKPDAKGFDSRTLDIDILYIDDMVFDTNTLTVPHPRLHKRRFALMPLNEIAPDFVHPVLNTSTHDLLLALPEDAGEIKRIF